VGTIWASASHPGRGGAGVGRLAEVARSHPAPRIAIGGVTPARAEEAIRAGAHGVAVVRGIWFAPDPRGALIRYLEVVERVANPDPPIHP
ncbi:MAG: thiamine phosphate synthase, partial [Longimicrobiales bacterium]|nr:thiamine phosphate synthase [Longimicrobiales bacterium]